MTASYPPKTPPRNFGRRCNLTPSTTPFMTPTKTPSKGHGRLSTSKSSRCHFLTPRSGSFNSPASKRTPSRTDEDRFIPSRSFTNSEMCRRALLTGEKRSRQASSTPVVQSQETPLQKEFKRRMFSSMCNVPLENLSEDGETTNLLAYGVPRSVSRSFKVNEESPGDPFSHDILRSFKLGNTDVDEVANMQIAKKVTRRVPSAPTRVLDAPDIVDDYYLNLISWSKDNILAVALARTVYLWNASSNEIHHLYTADQGNDYVTSVNWCPLSGQTKYVAVGTNSNRVHLFDGQTLRKVRTMGGHTSRVSSLAWSQNWLSSGGRDSGIINHDVRSSHSIVSTYRAHTQEVCGLKWNEDSSCLASGGNENYLCLWDASMSDRQSRTRTQLPSASSTHGPRSILKHHKAAVKALDWCPFRRGILASGGGTADRTIKFWNSSNGAMLNSVDTGSQVCSIIWSKHQRELCSSHGFSENQLILWKLPDMTRIKELTGHTARVLNMDISPDGTSIVSAGADETLRFWDVFETSSHRSKSGMPLLGEPFFGGPVIR